GRSVLLDRGGQPGTFREKIRAVGHISPKDHRVRFLAAHAAGLRDRGPLPDPVVAGRGLLTLQAGRVADFWVLLLWFPPGSAPKGIAMLALGSYKPCAGLPV